MTPSALSGQLQQGLADFLRFSFWSSTPGMEHVINDLLDEPGGLLKGPYVSLKLPFVSGTNPDFFPHVPLGFMPHHHQEQAFARLGGSRKWSTLVATGTGSGKTESFLLPILDHCRAAAGERGVKAILIYPMNALATDQAGRIARMIHGNPALRGHVRAGLYIGEDGGKHAKTQTKMGATTLITDRATMQASPPDILLTNYKMLDYLLLRPGDQRIWQFNQGGTLRFLVVDEIHTFDGAQGTDLACLIRRLKRRLQVDDGRLCCVGTSATLGGDAARHQLLQYATSVFGEPFDANAVIGESRQTEQAYLSGCPRETTDEPAPDDRAALDPARSVDPATWLRDQVRLWFGDVHDTTGNAWAVELGDRLKGHAAFQSLLTALGGETTDLTRLGERMARQRSAWRADPSFGRLALQSLIALVSAARAWRAELPDVAAAREAAGKSRPVQPFLDVRVQLWQRELRRMVGSLSDRPRLRHSMDLDRESRRKHLPMVHCRECGAMGWATLVQLDRPHVISTDLDAFYRAFFANDPRVAFLYPAKSVPQRDKSWPSEPFAIALDSMTRVGPDETPDGPVVTVVQAFSTHSTPQGLKLTRDCPFCAARESLALIGFRAATLTSVYVDQLFASPFNDDKKLLTFSDSVQDAAHRAGFFGARTWRTNLRVAMLHVIQQREGLTLGELAYTLGTVWQAQLDMPTWVSTFLAPNMAWLHDWERLRADGALPKGSDLGDQIKRRLAFEVSSEFGLQAGIGRSLPRTGTATVALDRARLDAAVAALLEPLQNEVPGLRDLSAGQLRHFVLGLLHHLRTRGGILDDTIPLAYIETGGKDVHAFTRDVALPGFTASSRLPEFLIDHSSTRFQTWSAKSSSGWLDRWVLIALGSSRALTGSPADTYPVILPGLLAAGLLEERRGAKGERIWGLSPEAMIVSSKVGRITCLQCSDTKAIALAELDLWRDAPCLTARCPGLYAIDTASTEDYFARLYAGGDLHRIVAEEHTGLLSRAEREQVELEFKALPGPPTDPTARKPWYANLLSCTPTLEMGIDIGDLSTAILCSVPPAQANYMQRIGRAGRKDGNSFVLTVAAGSPHDLYFFAEPAEMFAGEIAPPGVFLDAPAVLERQLTAFCFDRWVAAAGDDAELPAQLRSVFGRLDDKGKAHFPATFLDFVEARQPTLLREFLDMFADTISPDTRSHLERYLIGATDGTAGLRWKILDAFHRELRQRDSLASKAQALRTEIKRLSEQEAKSANHDEEVALFEREKNALVALVMGINRQRTLEFLTGEGLLPNYAFPEAAVSLKSVIWRKKKAAPASGSKFETWSHEYKRSPASALSELAPDAEFYAGGRHVRIDQVDVAVSKPERWRFCAECNHAQSIETGDEAANCPACQSEAWKDEGQVLRLLKLQQVFARAPDRESRIRDDKDDRQPRFFQRQIMVDIKDQDQAGAWHVDDASLPFGFEYLKRATFREVNFGEPSDQGSASMIAGREAVRPGFRLCARCGMVQKPKGEPVHALSCSSRKPGAKLELEDCLYLYREFQSEAIRLLLPVTDIGTTKQLHSFVAALQLGLKVRFGGSIDHLSTTVYSDPVADTVLRKQYLVLYDTVPGGTGYLKQLVTPRTEGARMPLYEVLQSALERVEGCRCWNDPDRDGCYRCLYAYRNAHDMDDTSALAASELLHRLIDGERKLKTIASLGEVSITGLMDSVLELRFVEALRLITDPATAQPAKLTPAVVNQKPGYRWSLGNAEWLVEPQLTPPLAETCGIPVSIDFVMRPASAGDGRKLAIFLDGWAFHKDRVGRDLRQRMALLASGNWDVWTFTWQDLDEKFGLGAKTEPPELAIPDPVKLKTMLQQVGLTTHANIGAQSVCQWFEAELLSDGLPWDKIAKSVLAARMTDARASDAAKWTAFVEGIAPPVAQALLGQMMPRLVTTDSGTLNPHFALMAVHDGADPALICTLDDREQHYASPEYWAAWRGYLRLFQLLRHLPNAWFMTRSGTADGDAYNGIGRALDLVPGQSAWSDFDDIEAEFQDVARTLMDAGVRAPVVGMEIPDTRGDVWAEAELLWDAEQVALTSRDLAEDARGTPASGWSIFFVEELPEDAAPLLEALR